MTITITADTWDVVLALATVVLAAATGVLAGAAIWAGKSAVGNIKVLREQNRQATFLALMSDVADSKAREDRAILHKIYDETRQKSLEPKHVVDFFIARGGGVHLWKEYPLDTGVAMGILRKVQKDMEIRESEVFRRFRDAVEQTISLFDRMGFFLLRNDSSLLIEESPDWLWDMTDNMWDYLGKYIIARQDGKEKHYGKYFRDLAEIAKGKVKSV